GDDQVGRNQKAGCKTIGFATRAIQLDDTADRDTSQTCRLIGRRVVEVQSGTDTTLREEGFGHASLRIRQLLGLFTCTEKLYTLWAVGTFRAADLQQADSLGAARQESSPAFASFDRSLKLSFPYVLFVGLGAPACPLGDSAEIKVSFQVE